MEHRKSSEFLTFLPSEKKVLARPDKTILDLAIEHGIPLNHSCGGGGSCGTCLVEVEVEGEAGAEVAAGAGVAIGAGAEVAAGAGVTTGAATGVGSGRLAPRNLIEKEMAEERGFETHERLGCQTSACAGLLVRVPVLEDF